MGKYTFDFNAEVARACAEYPEETKNLTFIDLAAADAKERVRAWHAVRIGRYVYELFFADKNNRAMYEAAFGVQASDTIADLDPVAYIKHVRRFQEMIDKATEKTLQSDAEYFPGDGCGLIVMDASKSNGLLGDPEKSRLFTLSHELGHRVVPGAGTRAPFKTFADVFDVTSENQCEKKADTFAMIRGLQQEIFDTEDVKILAENRLLYAETEKDMGHFTSIALATIPPIVNGLSPAEMAAIAARHAELFPEIVTDEKDMPQIVAAVKKLWAPNSR